MIETQAETEVVSKEKKIVRPYVDVEEIRKAYPNPSTVAERKEDSYCVGGAFMQFIGIDAKFPTGNLFHVLQCTNPNLRASMHIQAGMKIMCANDSGDFEGAWQALKEALEYGCDTSKETNDETRAAARSPG